MIDLHCHILPEIDDGSKSGAETVQMCRMAAADGIRHIMATPHYLDGRFDPDPLLRDKKVATLNAALHDAGLDLQIHAGAEVHLVPELASILKKRPELRLAGTRYVLVELPQIFPQTFSEELFQIRLTGLTPILAHVERYEAVQRDPDMLLPLINSGVLTQITAQSLTGDFGDPCRICAETLVQCHTAHILATDAHSLNRRPPVLTRVRSRVVELAGQHEFESMTVSRPQAILDNAPVIISEAIPIQDIPKPGLLARLGAWF